MSADVPCPHAGGRRDRYTYVPALRQMLEDGTGLDLEELDLS
jgi:hypothetical protein